MSNIESMETAPHPIRINFNEYMARYLSLSINSNLEEDISAFNKKIEAITSDLHPSNHELKENSKFPGICGECGWVPSGIKAYVGEEEVDLRTYILSQKFEAPVVPLSTSEILDLSDYLAF